MVHLGVHEASSHAQPKGRWVVLPQRVKVNLILLPNEGLELVLVDSVAGAAVAIWGPIQIMQLTGAGAPEV